MTTAKRDRYMEIGVIATNNDGYLAPELYEEFKELINEMLDDFEKENPFAIDERDLRPVREQLILISKDARKVTIIKDSRKV